MLPPNKGTTVMFAYKQSLEPMLWVYILPLDCAMNIGMEAMNSIIKTRLDYEW